MSHSLSTYASHYAYLKDAGTCLPDATTFSSVIRACGPDILTAFRILNEAEAENLNDGHVYSSAIFSAATWVSRRDTKAKMGIRETPEDNLSLTVVGTPISYYLWQ